MFDPPSIVSLVSGHGIILYEAILLITIFEGPMFTVIAASLVATGVFSVIPILSLITLGDVIGDSMHHSIGRFAGRPLLNPFDLNETALHKAKSCFERRPIAMLILSKLAHGAGAAGLIVAGAVRAPYRKYVTRYPAGCPQNSRRRW